MAGETTPTTQQPVSVTPTVAGKVVGSANVGANIGTFAMLAYYMLQGLPSVEQRHDARLTEMQTSHKESIAAITTSIVEMNRNMQLLRDEMRDARHDLTELRRGNRIENKSAQPHP